MSFRRASLLLLVLVLAFAFALPLLASSVAGATLARAQQPPPVAASPFALRGRVVDEQGRPVAGARVFCLVVPTRLKLAASETTTGEDGSFRLPCGEGSGKALLHAVKDGLAPDDGWAESEGPPITITLTRGITVRGVVRGSGGEVVPGAKVALDLSFYRISRSRGQFPGSSPRQTTTDANAAYALDHLPRSAHLRAVARGYSVEEIAVAGEVGAECTADITLSHVGLAAGQVINARTGMPLEGALVNREATTDKSGRFEVTRRLLGQSSVPTARVERPGFVASVIDLPRDGKELVVALEPELVWSGRVVNAERKPVGEATLRVFGRPATPANGGARIDQLVHTAADGTFSVALPAGSYDPVAVVHDHYWLVMIPGFTLPEEPGALSLEIVIGKGASLTVVVTDEQGRAIESALVTLLDSGAPRAEAVATGPTTFRGLPAIPITLSVQSAGFVPFEERVPITAGAEHSRNVALRRSP